MEKIEIDFDKVYEYNYWDGSMGCSKNGVVHQFRLPINHGIHRDWLGTFKRAIAADESIVIEYFSYQPCKVYSEKEIAFEEYSIVLAKGTTGTNYAHEGPTTERKGKTFNQFLDEVEKYNPGFKEKVTNVHGIEYNHNHWG